MKYTININQKALEENFPGKLDIIDAAILDYILSICLADNKNLKQLTIEEKGNSFRYTWINYNQLLKEMPLLRINQKPSITNRLKKIVKTGIIKTYKAPDQNVYIRITEQASKLFFDSSKLLIKTNGPLVKTNRSISLNKWIYNNNTNNNNKLLLRNNNDFKKSSKSKPKSKSLKITRKTFKVPPEVYKEISDAYEKYKEIKLKGAEYGQVRQAIKTMLYSERTKEEIINFMRFCFKICQEIKEGNQEIEKKFGWLQGWTIITIKRKLPEFLAGKFSLEDTDLRIPDYAKKFQK